MDNQEKNNSSDWVLSFTIILFTINFFISLYFNNQSTKEYIKLDKKIFDVEMNVKYGKYKDK